MNKNRKNTTRVAVICASNPGNAGMYSVDLAAHQFFTELGVEFELMTSHAPSKLARYRLLKLGFDIGHRNVEHYGNLLFHRLKSRSQFSEFTHVVYWGDFTPNPVYGREDYIRLIRRYDTKLWPNQALAKWSELYNLCDGAISARTLAVGNNFQHDFKRDTSFDLALENLQTYFDGILPRDSYSVKNLKSCFDEKNRGKVGLGMDPAFLLNTNKLPGITQNQSGHFCYQFSRANLPSIGQVIERFGEQNNLASIQLDQWSTLKSGQAEVLFSKYISQIRSADCVITDLYHLAINAIREGTPVICLGNPSTTQLGSLGDFKKKILFEMLDMKECYIEIDEHGHVLGNTSEDVEKILTHRLQDIKSDLPAKTAHVRKLISEFSQAIVSNLRL